MLPLGRGARERPLRISRTVLFALCLTSFSLLSTGLAAPARGLTMDFEGLAHGEILDGVLNMGVIRSIETNNRGRGPDLAIIFDSTERNTADDDLEGPKANLSDGSRWAGGNLPSDTYLGNILIISENKKLNSDGHIDDPDDEGSKPAGSVHIVLNDLYTDFGFDLVDIEDNRERMGSIEFILRGSSLGEIAFEDLPSLQSNISFGNNTANRIDPINTMDAFQVTAFEEVVVRFGGSGGITNFVLTPITPVPEPGTALLVGLGVVAMAAARARRHQPVS